MKRLVIIDGKSVFYRGYYAMGALATSNGTPTGGVYGFAAIAMEIVKTLRPTKVVVAWDKAKTSVAKRKEIYSGYKAGRAKPPEDFYAQIPLLRELVMALGWGFLECDGYEADDIIGTLAWQADNDLDETGKCKWETFIVSSDLDMLQIVDENTRMYRLLKGFTKLEELDVPAVEAKYGIKKKQFLDLKALKGDASDNIPGVLGIGEKGAVKLLNEYGSLEGIYKNIDKIGGAMRQKLVGGEASARMSYALAKIMTDAPVELKKVPELVMDKEKTAEALKKLEFFSLIKKFRLDDVGDGMGDKNETAGDGDEVASGDGGKNGVGGGDKAEGEVGGGDEAENGDEVAKKMPAIVDWNIKQEMHNDAGVARAVLEGEKFWDLGQGRFLLDPLAKKESAQLSLLDRREKEANKVEYARQQEEYEKFPKLKRILLQLDFPLIPVLYKIEKAGMKIDLEYFEKLRREYAEKSLALEQKIYSLAGREFNINSPIQLAEILFGVLFLPTKGIKKTARGYSTEAKALEKLKNMHPIVGEVMRYREVSKLLSTYIVPLPELADKQARVHTTFTQDVTATGRLSSLNPNMQNIPTRTEEGKKIRTGFIAEEGKVLVSADYSQFELRLAAALANDEGLLKDFNAGIDIHKKTAAEAFGLAMDEVTKQQRRAAKVINFGILYGMSAKGLADAAGMSVSEAKTFMMRYFKLRSAIKDKLEDYLRQARENGYVETYYGRRRPTPDVKSSNYLIRSGAERAAQNMPIQGTEADLMKKAMLAVDASLPEGAQIVMQVHDSLIVECDEGVRRQVGEILKEKMEGVAPELPVKLLVEVTSGRNWGEL